MLLGSSGSSAAPPVLPGPERTLPLVHYGPDEGLPRSVVLALHQDPRGPLWIGTPGGLASFDGVGFRRFDEDDGLPDQLVRSILIDGRGALWVGSETGVSRRGPGEERFERRGPPDLRVPYRCLIEGPDGALWAGTWSGGVVRIPADGPARAFATDDGLAHDIVRACHRSRDGRLWFGTYGGGLSRVTGDASEPGFETLGKEAGLTDLSVRSLAEDPSGRLVVGTTSGIFRQIAPGGDRFEPWLAAATPPYGAINDLLVDSRERLWIGTRRSGACVVEDGVAPRCFRTSNEASENSVLALLEDREGSLWLGTWTGGLAHLTTEGFHVLPPDSAPAHPNAHAVLRTTDGALWLGTHGGGLTRWGPDGRRSWTTVDGLPSDKVLSLAEDRTGAVWAGTLEGAARLDGDRFVPVETPSTRGTPVVFDIAPDDDGTIWLGTGSGLVRWRDGEATLLTPDDGLPAHRINAVLPARAGGLWLATADGFSHYDGRRFENRATQEGDDYVISLLEDEDGLWLGTARGLFRFDGSTVRPAPEHLSPGRVSCGVVLGDRDGRLWIGTPSGIRVADERGLSTVFTSRDGVPSSEVNEGAGALDRDGRLWFGTVRGFVVFDPAVALRPPPEPAVHLSGVLAGGRPVGSGSVELPHDRNEVRAELRAVSLSAPDEIVRQVRMEGLDSDWTTVDAPSVDFRSLPAGDYRLRYRARVRDSAWAEAEAVDLAILAPWWETPLARGLGLAILLGLGATIYRARTRRLRERERLLEHLVAERTAQLQLLNDQKDELLGIVAHDLRSPLSGIRGFADLLLARWSKGEETANDGNATAQDRRFLENIRAAAEHMHRLADDLLDAAAIESGRVRLRRRAVVLSDLLETHASYLRSRAERKGIRLRLDCPADQTRVDVDPDRIGEVFDNLVSNAIKYTEAGGEIRVSCDVDEESVTVHVRDTGLGLAPEELPHVFTGRRLSARPTGGEASTGLGLAIVKKLVELHDGSVRAESVLGEGSRFSVSLPRA